jgi:putative endonuclease
LNYTYILECKDGTYYTGWTNNLEKRLKNHNAGRGAKYTKARLPVCLIYYEEFQSKEDAMRREYEIKGMTRKAKFNLITMNTCRKSKED